MEKIFSKTTGLTEKPFTYCPGCQHGIIHRIIGECLEELNIVDESISIASVGCSVMSYDNFACNSVQASHGRAPAVATGLKRTNPDKMVFTYQGDGDFASIGMGEAIHAAGRGENVTLILVNNAIYGMTGGQMAPTTLIGQKTTTSPTGRKEDGQGLPLKVSELFGQIPSVNYVERTAAYTPAQIRATKKSIKKAFQNQLDGKGFSLVEILSTCSIGWGMTPTESIDWAQENMINYFPLGVIKDEGEIKWQIK